MNKSTSRVISKAGFLVIITGFLMPIMFNQNGFQTTNYLSGFFNENAEKFSKLLDKEAENFDGEKAEMFLIFKNGKNVAGISLYAIFSISCIGAALFILLLIKKYKFSIIFDWVIIILANIAILAIFSGIVNVLRYTPVEFSVFDVSGIGKRAGSINNVLFPLLKFGSFFIIAGLLISTVFNLMASFTYEKDGKITYDVKIILVSSFIIFSIIFGCSLAIITG
jgi:hypothetical protein